MKIGDKVLIKDGEHPWTRKTGILLSYESYGPQIMGWKGWRVELENGMTCFVSPAGLEVL